MLRNTLLACAAFVAAASTSIYAQNFKVQVGAFAEPVEVNYFRDRGIEQVYESVDQLGIFHYFVGAYPTREDAEQVEQQLKDKGFRNALIFDQEAQRALCGNPCPYFDDRSIYFDENSQLLAIKSIHFDFAKSSVDIEGRMILKEIYQNLLENPGSQLKIFSYTDNQGSSLSNIELAKRRARAARNELTAMGIHAERMFIKVFGELDPARPNTDDLGKDSPENRRLNRRVVLAVMQPSGEIKTIEQGKPANEQVKKKK